MVTGVLLVTLLYPLYPYDVLQKGYNGRLYVQEREILIEQYVIVTKVSEEENEKLRAVPNCHGVEMLNYL
ncbi:hypothetical protein SAMN02910358_01227 [Lachnospiraceae bacterium XBB1006]|nr:hypothetical protein SAMN02910358_01227 [Lachnospiraceae bacterium XBB1006]